MQLQNNYVYIDIATCIGVYIFLVNMYVAIFREEFKVDMIQLSVQCKEH